MVRFAREGTKMLEVPRTSETKRGGWTNKELGRASDLWMQGLTITQIAQELGRTNRSIQHQILDKRELFPRRRAYRRDVKREHPPVYMKLSITLFMHNLLKKEARRRGVSMNTVIRDAVRGVLMPAKSNPSAKKST